MSREALPALASTAFGTTSTPNPETHSLEIYYINRYYSVQTLFLGESLPKLILNLGTRY
jgi:hypothetical protein